MTILTPNCSSATSFSESWSSRYIAYRRPEHPPGCTATRSAMSARPSSSTSSFTLPAAVCVSWIIVPPVDFSLERAVPGVRETSDLDGRTGRPRDRLYPRPAGIPPGASGFAEVRDHSASHPDELLGRDAEHGVG